MKIHYLFTLLPMEIFSPQKYFGASHQCSVLLNNWRSLRLKVSGSPEIINWFEKTFFTPLFLSRTSSTPSKVDFGFVKFYKWSKFWFLRPENTLRQICCMEQASVIQLFKIPLQHYFVSSGIGVSRGFTGQRHLRQYNITVYIESHLLVAW